MRFEQNKMKIVTWNVNGLRSLIKEFGGIDNVFRVLDADIVCFQVFPSNYF